MGICKPWGLGLVHPLLPPVPVAHPRLGPQSRLLGAAGQGGAASPVDTEASPHGSGFPRVLEEETGVPRGRGAFRRSRPPSVAAASVVLWAQL